jgi:hypothetical protein
MNLWKQSSNKLISQKSSKKLKEPTKAYPIINRKNPIKKVGNINLNDERKIKTIPANNKNLANLNLDNLRPSYNCNFPIDIAKKKAKDVDKNVHARKIEPKKFYKDWNQSVFIYFNEDSRQNEGSLQNYNTE